MVDVGKRPRIRRLDSLRKHWLDTSLRNKGWAVVLLPTIALLISFFGLIAVVLTSRSASNGVKSSLQAQSSLQTVLTLTIDAETGVRGYLISKDNSYLAPFQTANQNLNQTFSSLSNELSGDKLSAATLSQLKTEVSADIGLLTNLQKVGTGPEEISLLSQEKRQTDVVRALVNTLDARIATIVSNKEATANNVANSGLWIAAAALLMGLIGGAAATQLFTTGIAARIRELQRGAERIAHGEPAEELPAAEDEVGRLAAALSEASDLLEARELALREETAFFEHLVSASPVVKFESDSGLPGNGFVSTNLNRVFSLSSELVSTDSGNWLDAIHPEDRETVLAEAASAIAARTSELASTYRMHGQDGIQRWVYSIATLSYDDADGSPSALGVLLDVTEGREATTALREREEMLHALFDASPDAVLVIDQSGMMKMASNAFAQLTGVSTSDAEAVNFYDFLDNDELAQIEEELTLSLSEARPTFVRRMRLRSSENGWRITEGHGVALDFGMSNNDLLLVLRDVTPQVELEDKLTAATNAAETANRAKSDFLSRMSHELRTPLNAILGFAQLLELDELNSDQIDSVAQIRRGGQHLLQLINEVLDIARIEAGRLALSKERVGVSEVINEVANLLRPLAELREIDISLVSDGKTGEMVLADRQRLRQILLNIVSNAIKYNHQGGSVAISNSFNADTVTIAITDTGPGISPEQIDMAFAPFERLGAEASEIEGTGIGLTLSRHLAEVMGGTLTLESTSDGSTFFLTLPYGGILDSGSEESIMKVTELKRPGAGSELRVLYVEDNLSNVRLIERALSRLGNIELRVSSHGRQAIDLALEEPPHLVLLDLHLPDIGGEEVLSKLRSEISTREVPVVVLSADATDSQIRKLLAVGATDYLTKPVDIERLFEIIEQIRLDYTINGDGHHDN